MLTGDKVGTAKNIAMACNILPPNADVLELTTETYPVLSELSATRMGEVQKIVAEAMVAATPVEASGLLGKLGHKLALLMGSREAEEAYRAAVAAVRHAMGPQPRPWDPSPGHGAPTDPP